MNLHNIKKKKKKIIYEQKSFVVLAPGLMSIFHRFLTTNLDLSHPELRFTF
jgi:hypothetical protein